MFSAAIAFVMLVSSFLMPASATKQYVTVFPYCDSGPKNVFIFGETNLSSGRFVLNGVIDGEMVVVSQNLANQDERAFGLSSGPYQTQVVKGSYLWEITNNAGKVVKKGSGRINCSFWYEG